MELTTSILNDNFFMEQTKSSGDLDTPEGRAWWPDMYRKSKDFKLLRKVIHAAMLEYAGRHGLVAPPEPWQPAAHPDMYDVSLWAAVYPDDSVFPGARIGHHNHPGSLVSCVIYVQTSGQPTPIALVDPRGVDSTRDWHSVWQNKEESDYDAHTQRESSDLSIYLVAVPAFASLPANANGLTCARVCLLFQPRRRFIERSIFSQRKETSYASRLGWCTTCRR